MVNKLLDFCGGRKLFTPFAEACNRTLSSARLILTTSSLPALSKLVFSAGCFKRIYDGAGLFVQNALHNTIQYNTSVQQLNTASRIFLQDPASTKVPHNLLNPKVNCLVDYSQPLVSVLSQKNGLHTSLSHFCKASDRTSG